MSLSQVDVRIPKNVKMIIALKARNTSILFVCKWGFPLLCPPPNRWFLKESATKMDDFEVPVF